MRKAARERQKEIADKNRANKKPTGGRGMSRKMRYALLAGVRGKKERARHARQTAVVDYAVRTQEETRETDVRAFYCSETSRLMVIGEDLNFQGVHDRKYILEQEQRGASTYDWSTGKTTPGTVLRPEKSALIRDSITRDGIGAIVLETESTDDAKRIATKLGAKGKITARNYQGEAAHMFDNATSAGLYSSVDKRDGVVSIDGVLSMAQQEMSATTSSSVRGDRNLERLEKMVREGTNYTGEY